MLTWMILSAGVTVLLVAAMDIKNHKICKGLKIDITEAKEFYFLNTQDIIQLISANGMNHPVGKPIAACNLQQMETALERNVWIKDAQLFFDNNLVLHVHVSEREPVARIFDAGGQSFYVDSSGFVIPLSAKRLPVQLPVFTGFPHSDEGHTSGDSLLIMQIRDMSQYIRQDSFWKAQIAQVDITPRKTFEITPTLGNHLIEFGDGENYTVKFKRLFLFYQQVLGRYGLDRYARISVQYKDQVIGTRKTAVSRIDSVQAVKNIRKMIDQAQVIATDTASLQEDPALHATNHTNVNAAVPPVNSGNERTPKRDVEKIKVPVKQPVARTGRQTSEAHVKAPSVVTPKTGTPAPKPKAVMHKQH